MEGVGIVPVFFFVPTVSVIYPGAIVAWFPLFSGLPRAWWGHRGRVLLVA